MWSRVSLAWSRLLLRWSRRRWPRMPVWHGVPMWSRRTVLNVAGSVVSVLIAFAAILFALLADKGSRHPAAASRQPLPSDSTSESTIYIPPLGGTTFPGFPSDTATTSASTSITDTGTAAGGASGSSTPGGLTVDQARQAVVAYINAVNARNRVQAGALICQSLLPTWLQNVDAPNSDFNFTISDARFVASSTLGGSSVFLRYTLVFNDNSVNEVDFTVIDESGPKICGEQRV